MQNRFRSGLAWTTVGSTIVGALISFGVIDTGLGEAVNALIVAACNVLVMVGIFNNPTNKNSF